TRPTTREKREMRKYALGSAVVLGVTVLSLYVATPVWAADDELVAKAKKLVGQAIEGLVATTNPKKPELELTIDDFQPVTGWVGPKTSAKAPEHKKVVAISD